MAKALTPTQVPEIKRKLFGKQTQASLAREYKVSPKTIKRRSLDNQPQKGPESPITRKRQVNLSIKRKLDIIERLEKGESSKDLAQLYNVDPSTITRAKSKKSEILKRAATLKQEKRALDSKRICTENNIRDQALYSWFEEERAAGTPISGSCLREKALELHQEKKLSGDFKASSGWLDNFKSRYGIRELSLQGEKLSADSAGAEDFKNELEDFIVEGGYSLDQVYNGDETALYFRSLPKKTLVADYERQAAGYKEPKERVTIMCCANASGSHKITPLVIGKYAKPRCFAKNKEKSVFIPVKYTSSKSAWMNRTLFLDWFKNIFIQEVKEKHPERRKVLLLLDNAPSHPPADQLNQIDETIQVKSLPPNVTALVQPMDQGVIAKMKKLYRKKDISNAWNRLLDKDDFPREQQISNEEVNQLLALLKDAPEYADCTFDMAAAWIAADFQENAWERSNVIEIYERLTSSSNNSEEISEEEEEETDKSDDICKPEEEVLHEEAYKAAMTLRSFLEKTWDSTAIQIQNVQNVTDF